MRQPSAKFTFNYIIFKLLKLICSFDLSIGSTETKYIKLNTKTQFLKITFDFCIHFLVPPVKVYKKLSNFHLNDKKRFWVLVFSFMYLVSIDPVDH